MKYNRKHIYLLGIFLLSPQIFCCAERNIQETHTAPIDYFRWDQVIEQDKNDPNKTIVVNYTTTTYTQTDGTCYLFAVIGAMEVQVAIDSNMWWDWGNETERGFRLSTLNVWNCNHYISPESGFISEPMRWVEHHGIPEDCFNPYVPPFPGYEDRFEDRPLCGNCNEYLKEIDTPTSCSPWQRSNNMVLYYRHTGSYRPNVIGNKTRQDLENFAYAIYNGPIVEKLIFGTSSEKKNCDPTSSNGGAHVVVLIGYDISNENDLLLVKNSQGDEHFWISYYEWAGKHDVNNPKGCGLGIDSIKPGSFSKPEPINLNNKNASQLGDDFHHSEDNHHPYKRICIEIDQTKKDI